MAKSSHDEIEVKIAVPDRAALVRKLRRLGAKPDGARQYEMNALYDTRDGALARKAQMLRIRIEHEAKGNAKRPGKAIGGSAGTPVRTPALLTYKGPSNRGQSARGGQYKIREEHEVTVSDANTMARLLELFGLRPWFRYEKYRAAYALPRIKRLKVDLDETPIGDFLELEGDCRAIDRAAEMLGFSAYDYIDRSYGALFQERSGGKKRSADGKRSAAKGSRSDEPTPRSGLGDMLFRRQRPKR